MQIVSGDNPYALKLGLSSSLGVRVTDAPVIVISVKVILQFGTIIVIWKNKTMGHTGSVASGDFLFVQLCLTVYNQEIINPHGFSATAMALM